MQARHFDVMDRLQVGMVRCVMCVIPTQNEDHRDRREDSPAVFRGAFAL